MAKLSRLNICGIRSFGPHDNDMQTVKFSNPVTLILGENGCGKTTIIECLKYACTGELPGGTKSGQGFVNDPKLSSSSTTKGRVLLKIIDAKGNKVVISKAMKLELKNATQKFSSMDSTIQVTKPNGEKMDLSSRCADIGQQACAFMGVSKSIINNVIFCHQENSLWPLEESKKLKEKFDEIFDATKYNVCIDSTRKRIKTESVNLKVLNENVIGKREKKNAVEKERAKLESMQEQIAIMTQGIETRKLEMEPIETRIKAICELECKLGDLQKKLGAKDMEKKNIVEKQKNLLEKLKREFEGSDLDLQKAISSFDENFSKTDSELKQLENQKEGLEKEELVQNGIVQKLQVRLGQLQEEKTQQDRMIKERNELMKELIPQLEPTINYDAENIDEVNKAIQSLHDALEKSKSTFQALCDRFDTEEEDMQRSIDVCRSEVIKLEQKIKTNHSLVAETCKKARLISSQLKKLDISDEELARYNSDIDKLDGQLTALTDSLDTELLASKISKNKQDIKTNEATLEILEKEYKILQKNYLVENNIETGTRDIKKRQHEVEELRSKYFDELEQLFEEVPSSNYKMSIEKCRQDNQNKVNSITRSVEVTKKDVTTFETNLRFQEDKLQNFTDELNSDEKKIFDLCDNRPFIRVSSDIEAEIEKLHKTLGQLRAAKVMYEKFVRDFQAEKPCCPICDTDFNNNQAVVGKIVTKIKSQIQGIPSELTKFEDKLKQKQELYDQIQQLKPVYTKTEKFKNTLIPDLKIEIQNLAGKLGDAKKDLNKLSEELYDPQKKVTICNKIIGDVTLIDSHQHEIGKLEKSTKDLQTQLIKSSNKSREQVEDDIDVLKIDLVELRHQCETDQKKLDLHKTKCQELREQRNKTVEKRLQLEKTMQDKPHLQEQLKELTEKEKTLGATIKEQESQLEPVTNKLKTAISHLEEAKAKNKVVLDGERKTAKGLEMKYGTLERKQIEIKASVEKDVNGQFTTTLKKFAMIKQELDDLKDKMVKISQQISTLNQLLVSREFEKRKLEENLELRTSRKQLEKLAEEIASLELQIGAYSYEKLQKEKKGLQSKCITLERDICNIEGQKTVLEQAIVESTDELNKPEKKYAYKFYKEKALELKLIENSVADMKLFVMGLENAIIEFHKEKMLRINEAIRQLWTAIYRGNDIDYIQIRTEEAVSKTSRRMYDYKVVQIKSDVELEMRGRCSAGQKVLACLIIRMALAETFSHNCGILALDEPTTNLDRDNISSLSEALTRMINTRGREKNFQLIVITHDESFIRTLSQSEGIDYCIRVSRNGNGNSMLTNENI